MKTQAIKKKVFFVYIEWKTTFGPNPKLRSVQFMLQIHSTEGKTYILNALCDIWTSGQPKNALLLATPAPSIWYLHFHKYPHLHKKNIDDYIYNTQIPHTKKYICVFVLPLYFIPTKKLKCFTLIFLRSCVTNKCKNK